MLNRWTELSFWLTHVRRRRTHRVFFFRNDTINKLRETGLNGSRAASYAMYKQIVNMYMEMPGFIPFTCTETADHVPTIWTRNKNHFNFQKWSVNYRSHCVEITELKFNIFLLLKYVIIFILHSRPEANDIRIRAHTPFIGSALIWLFITFIG